MIEHTYRDVQRALNFNPESLPERSHASYMDKFQHEAWVKNFNALADELFGSQLGGLGRAPGGFSPYDEHRVKTLRHRLGRIPTATRREFGLKPKAVKS